VIRHMGDCPHGRSEPTEDNDEAPIADEYDDSGAHRGSPSGQRKMQMHTWLIGTVWIES